MNSLIPSFICLPLVAALVMIPAAKWNRKLPDVIGNSVMIFLAAAAIALYFFRPLSSVMIYRIGGFTVPMGMDLILDGLSHLLILIINCVACIAAFYSISYMEKYTGKEKYYALFLLMVAGLNGAVLTGDLVTLFIFLELSSISSAALVAFGTEADELEASFKYLVMGAVASAFILLAIALIYGMTGTLNMAQAAISLPICSSYAKVIAVVLFLVGFGTKAAVAPFHAWLPDAHPAAPAPISAMLSGVLIKALGIYSIIRIIYNVIGITYGISDVMLFLGALSIIWGSFLAIGQWDMKRLFACSSISQIGYIVMGLGLATPLGVMGGLFHLLNHAIFKPLLFLTAGAVEYSTGTRDMKKLGGLGGSMPVTSRASMIGSLAISGVPPFNGFWSKLFIIVACVQAGRIWLALIAVLGSIATLAYSLKVQKYSFFGTSTAVKAAKEVPATMMISMTVLAILCFVCGLFFPFVIAFLINPALSVAASGIAYSHSVLGGM